MDQIFEWLHLHPLFFNNRPKDAAVIPFPSEETTPPVTKIYFVMIKIPPLLQFVQIIRLFKK